MGLRPSRTSVPKGVQEDEDEEEGDKNDRMMVRMRMIRRWDDGDDLDDGYQATAKQSWVIILFYHSTVGQALFLSQPYR